MREMFTLTISMSLKQTAAIQKVAKKRRVALSVVIREAVADYLAKTKEGENAKG